MKTAWCLLICLSIVGFWLCAHAYFRESADTNAHIFHWRGLCIYAVLSFAAGVGLLRGYGPVAFSTLLASTISVTFVVSGVNPVPQLILFATIGFAIGLAIDHWLRRHKWEKSTGEQHVDNQSAR